MISPPKSPTSPHLPMVKIPSTIPMGSPASEPGVLVTGDGNIRAAHSSGQNVFFIDPESPQPPTSQGLSSIEALPVPTNGDIWELLLLEQEELTDLSGTVCSEMDSNDDEAGPSGLVETSEVTQGAESIGKPHKCTWDGCGKTFKHLSALTIHERTHTKEKPFTCTTCGKGFSQQGNLDTHKITHTGEKNHVCNTCGKRFSLKGNLNKHQLTHAIETAVSYGSRDEAGPSGLVDTSAVTQGAKNEHKPYKCSEEGCGKTFKHLSALTKHVLTHTGEKPFTCGECGKGFSQKCNLNTHKITHTGEKNYVCNTCGKRFSQKSTLIIHELTHTGEQSYQCDICGKMFNVKGNLTKHIKIHTGIKDYQCSECDMAFTQKGNLAKHQHQHRKHKGHKE